MDWYKYCNTLKQASVWFNLKPSTLFYNHILYYKRLKIKIDLTWREFFVSQVEISFMWFLRFKISSQLKKCFQLKMIENKSLNKIQKLTYCIGSGSSVAIWVNKLLHSFFCFHSFYFAQKFLLVFNFFFFITLSFIFPICV